LAIFADVTRQVFILISATTNAINDIFVTGVLRFPHLNLFQPKHYIEHVNLVSACPSLQRLLHLKLNISGLAQGHLRLEIIMNTAKRLNIVRESQAYWRIIINNPPLNLFDPWMFAELNVLMDDIEKDKDLKVVVFESGDEEFFMNHHDVVSRTIIPDQPGAAPFFNHWPTFVTRLVQSSVISIAKVRGRARAQGFEFALACDMRFASKERAKFALIEVGGSSIPGGGGVEWLSALTGRSRALEIVCGADDFDAETGERYGFVNRAVPDAELDDFVDAFARRMSRFEKRALETGKKMVNARAGVPSEGELWTSNHILQGVDSWPEAQKAFTRLTAAGFGEVGDFELNMGERLGDEPAA
jgi:enoyl-CoA hydratase/carnithine racemase